MKHNVKFKELVDARQESITTIANETGLDAEELRKAYVGEVKLTTQQVLKLTRYFGVSATELTDKKDDKNNTKSSNTSNTKKKNSKKIEEPCEAYVSKHDYDALMSAYKELKVEVKLLREVTLRLAILLGSEEEIEEND